jgi:MFS family permease
MVLQNWIDDLNLRCVEKWRIGLFGSFYFTGNVIGSTLLSQFGDTIGRIPLIRVGQGISVACYFSIVFLTRNLQFIYVFCFIIGLFSCWRLSLGFIYGQEIIKETKQNLGGAMFNLFDASVVIFSSLFLLKISRNWVSLHSVFIGIATLAFLISIIMPESPKFLVQRKDYEQACKSYNIIARYN